MAEPPDPALAQTITSTPTAPAKRSPVTQPTADESRPLRVVDPGDYAVRGEIARGGMGRVLRARDLRHRRPVAIKEMLADDASLALRFEREALITARLQHPGIVPVYEAGRWSDGAPFYAMKLVDGRPLDDLVKGKDYAARLALLPSMLAVCEALAYAHSEGVIHRDLKPSNVIVGDFGETIVIDWGLAKDTRAAEDEAAGGKEGGASSSQELTMAGSVLGTPSYMAPEQSAGEPADARSDVYALGAMLYRVLAGKPPYDGASANQVLGQLREGPPPPLGERAPEVPADLLAIVGKAMARDPEDRYADARALADELRRFQTGQLVGAHRYTIGQLLRRWLRRHRAAVAVGAAALVAVAVISVIAVQRVITSRNAAVEAQKQEETQRQQVERRRARADQLIDFMLNDLKDKLDRLDRLDVLEGIMTEVQKYENEFAGDDSDDRTLVRRWELHQLIGDVLMRKGDVKGSEAAYRESMRIAELLARRRPGPEPERMIADARASVGRALDTFGKYTEAAAELEAAVAALEGLVGRADQKDTEEALADALVALGASRLSLGDLDAAQRAYERSRDVSARALKAGDAGAFRRMGQAIIRIGEIHRRRGEHDTAMAIFTDALTKVDEILAAHPDDFDALFGKGIVLSEIGETHEAAGQLAEALARHQEAAGAFSRVVRVSPSGRNRFFHAMALGRAAGVRAAQKDPTAIAATRETLATLETLTATDPEYAEWQTELASDYLLLADLLAAQPVGQREARGLVDRTDYILDRLEKEGRLGPAYRDLRTREQAVRAKLP